MNQDFIDALHEIEKEKGISLDVISDALESALISSYKKNFGSAQNVLVDINKESGKVLVYSTKDVVEVVNDPYLEITIDEAKKLSDKHKVGDLIKIEITPKDFGRIAAQTAKQVVIQRIKDAERDVIFDEFINRENEIGKLYC